MALDSTITVISDHKGDSTTIQLEVKDKASGDVVPIPDWPIVCEIWDDSANVIKKATANITGGADEQITRTDEVNGILEIYLTKGQTTNFDNSSYIEVAMLLGSAKDTIFEGKFTLKKPRINWESI